MPDISTHEKTTVFFSIAIPTIMVLWLVLFFYGNYMAPNQFEYLPQKIREVHIISLFFRADVWHFPLSITKMISPPLGYSLTLSDSIPLMAILFKVLGLKTFQYFGVWFLVSFTLCVFFAYRITNKIFQNKPIQTGLGICLFIFMPFAWYHPYWVPWTAGQWTTLWALSLFFQKRRRLSNEWYGVLIFSVLIHPFFALTNFFLSVSDIIRLYLYKHRISVQQAATFFGNITAVTIITSACMGLYFTQTLADTTSEVEPLSFSYLFSLTIPAQYSASYLYPGLGIFLGLLPTPFIILLYPTVKYIKRYRPLVFCLALFFLLSLGGGFVLGEVASRVPYGSWIETRILPILTSGPRFFTPILWTLPVLVLQFLAWIEKNTKKIFVTLLLLAAVILQISQFQVILPTSEQIFTPINQRYANFIADRSQIIWVQKEPNNRDLPFFEQIAFYAYQNHKIISSAPSTRISSGYRPLMKDISGQLAARNFQTNAVYIIPVDIAPSNLKNYGTILRDNKIIFFKTKN